VSWSLLTPTRVPDWSAGSQTTVGERAGEQGLEATSVEAVRQLVAT